MLKNRVQVTDPQLVNLDHEHHPQRVQSPPLGEKVGFLTEDADHDEDIIRILPYLLSPQKFNMNALWFGPTAQKITPDTDFG